MAPECKVYRDQVRISELAARVGVPTSTVRYYERIGVLAPPTRTASGYRNYDEDAAARLLFVTRARRMGLSCEQILDLLPVWDGTNCAGAHERVSRLIREKRAEIDRRVQELQAFAAELAEVSAALEAAPPPQACRFDLSCCVPDGPSGFVPLELVRKKTRRPVSAR